MMAGENENVGGRFRSTQWTTILNAANLEGVAAESALAKLCEDYRPPLFHFACHWIGSMEDAEDLTQGFFYHLIQSNLPAKVLPRQGSFRKFLITAFKNYMRDDWRRSTRAKEIPAGKILSIDADDGPPRRAVEVGYASFLEEDLDRFWAESIRERVARQIEKDFAKRGKTELFQAISCLLRGEKPPKKYAEIAADIGTSEGVLKVEVMRMRDKFAKMFSDAVEETMADRSELEEERRYLLGLLFGPASAKL